MRKSIKKLCITLLVSSMLVSTHVSASVEDNTTPIERDGFFLRYKDFNKYLMPVDEIDELLTEFKLSNMKFHVCDSELEHIEVIEYTYTKKHSWSVVVYATQETIDMIKANKYK